jgi:hypothetical protein
MTDGPGVHIRSAGYGGFSFAILPLRSASRVRACSTIFRPRRRWLLLSHDVMRTDFSPPLRGGPPVTLSQLTDQPSKRHSIETA